MEELIPAPEQTIQPKRSVKKQLLISFFVLCLLLLTTAAVVLYGKGYRLGFQKGEPQISKTGILQFSSDPTGAQVFIDGHLTAVTNNEINLNPGKYEVTITKDGFNDWKKDIQIEKEVVSYADAELFPKAPTLQSVSTFGVESVTIDPSSTKLALKIASVSAKKNGIYVFDMTARSFPVLAGQSNSTQLVDDSLGVPFSQADLAWSPDGKQLLATVKNENNTSTYYLLKTDSFNDNPQDVTATIGDLSDSWNAQKKDKEIARLKSLKPAVQKFASENFKILSWSPDETKILYQASTSAQMPIMIKPRLIGNNLLYEQRELQEGSVYVYDSKEDINTRITEKSDGSPFTWFSDSKHLLYVHNSKIEILEDDGSNLTTIYAGPFIDHYAYPWPDGSKLVTLTNLGNTNTPPTLYTISLK